MKNNAMVRPPYPGFPPCYQIVDKIAGMNRDVLVIEILKELPITNIDLAYLKEQIEAVLQKAASNNKIIDRSAVYTSDTFDTELRKALRKS